MAWIKKMYIFYLFKRQRMPLILMYNHLLFQEATLNTKVLHRLTPGHCL